MAGPGDVFPNLNDPSSRLLLAQAVHSGLSLGAYPVSGISLWIDSTATLPASTPARRRLLQANLPANETVEVAVLGYNLEVTPELPKSDDLAARIEDGSATDGISAQLVAVGLVKEEHVGRIALGLIGKVSRDRLTEMLARKDGNPAFDLVPAGELENFSTAGLWHSGPQARHCAVSAPQHSSLQQRAPAELSSNHSIELAPQHSMLFQCVDSQLKPRLPLVMAFSLPPCCDAAVPAGKRCKGNWTEWTVCAPCANRTRTFTIPSRTQERDAESADPQPPTSRRLHKADNPKAGNGHGNGRANSNDQDSGNSKRPGSSHQEESDTHSGSDQHMEAYSSGSQVPGFGKRPSAQAGQNEGLAHAFGQGNGLALALGHIECAVVNNTVEVEACDCPEGYCAGEPAATAFAVAFDWACVAGSLNGTLCSGDCTGPSINGTAEALCNNGTYQITNNTCAIS